MDTLDSMDTTGDPTITHPLNGAPPEMMVIDDEVTIAPAPPHVNTPTAGTNDREHIRASSATPAPVAPVQLTTETPVLNETHMSDVPELEATATVTPAPVHVQTPASPGNVGRTNTRADSTTPTPVAPAPATEETDETIFDRTVKLATGSVAVSKNTPLHDIPELAQQYVPITSAEQGVDFRNFRKFCLKPPLWDQWTPEEYQKLGAFLGSLDLAPIARELNKPVQEVGCMVDNVAITPLYDAQEATRRGLEGMTKWFERYGRYGTPSREWTGKQIKGEFSGISFGIVCLTLENGNKLEVQRKHLTPADELWLKENLAASDRKTLSEDPAQYQDSGGDIPLENLREWTAEKIPAAFSSVSFQKVHLLRPDGSRLEIGKDQLIKDDRKWMKEEDEDGEPHVSKPSRYIIDGTIETEEALKHTSKNALEKNAMTVWRYWTMESYEGRMCGVSHEMMHIIVPDGSRKEIPFTALADDDKTWLRANVTLTKRKVLSGQAVKEAEEKSAAGVSESGSA